MLEIMVRYSGGDVLEEFLTDLVLARITLSFHFALNNFGASSGTNVLTLIKSLKTTITRVVLMLLHAAVYAHVLARSQF